MTNPTLASEENLTLLLRNLVQRYSKPDGPTMLSLAALVELINHVDRKCNDNIEKFRKVQLAAIALYFLPIAGKYTKPKRKIRMVQFRMKDVSFWKKKRKIDNRCASFETLLEFDSATLRADSQKPVLKINRFSTK